MKESNTKGQPGVPGKLKIGVLCLSIALFKEKKKTNPKHSGLKTEIAI